MHAKSKLIICSIGRKSKRKEGNEEGRKKRVSFLEIQEKAMRAPHGRQEGEFYAKLMKLFLS